MIPILIEENYSDNNRFHRVLEGVSLVARKKREEIAVYTHLCDVPKDAPVVILICGSLKWSEDTVRALNDMGIHPLVFGFQYLDTIYRYSSIAPNYTRSSYLITKYILSQHRGRIAVVGYNRDSLPDRLKLKGIEYAAKESGVMTEIFENNGNVTESVDRFAARADAFSAIVCCNDNVAVTIHRDHPSLLDGKGICSCSALKISEFFSAPYPVCRIDYHQAGIQLALLYAFLTKEEVVCSTVMTFDVGFAIGREELTLSSTVDIDGSGALSETEIDFFGDEALIPMERLDRMLTECDDIDLKILKALTESATYSEIAEKHYLGVNTVKYRIRKMLDTLGADSKKELLSAISLYGLVF